VLPIGRGGQRLAILVPSSSKVPHSGVLRTRQASREHPLEAVTHAPRQLVVN